MRSRASEDIGAGILRAPRAPGDSPAARARKSCARPRLPRSIAPTATRPSLGFDRSPRVVAPRRPARSRFSRPRERAGTRGGRAGTPERTSGGTCAVSRRGTRASWRSAGEPDQVREPPDLCGPRALGWRARDTARAPAPPTSGR